MRETAKCSTNIPAYLIDATAAIRGVAQNVYFNDGHLITCRCGVGLVLALSFQFMCNVGTKRQQLIGELQTNGTVAMVANPCRALGQTVRSPDVDQLESIDAIGAGGGSTVNGSLDGRPVGGTKSTGHGRGAEWMISQGVLAVGVDKVIRKYRNQNNVNRG